MTSLLISVVRIIKNTFGRRLKHILLPLCVVPPVKRAVLLQDTRWRSDQLYPLFYRSDLSQFENENNTLGIIIKDIGLLSQKNRHVA